MGNLRKGSAILLILFIALPALTVLAAKRANAQPAPSWASPTCESPAVPAWFWLIGLSFLIAAVLIALVLERRKKP